MNKLFKRVDTVFIPVHDLERALKWYVEVLGGVPGWRDESSNYQSITFGDTSITLCTSSVVPHMDNLSLFSLYTTSIERAHAHLNIHSEHVNAIQKDGADYFIFKDLDGNQIEVCTY